MKKCAHTRVVRASQRWSGCNALSVMRCATSGQEVVTDTIDSDRDSDNKCFTQRTHSVSYVSCLAFTKENEQQLMPCWKPPPSFSGDDSRENETNRCLMFLMIGKLPFYCISERAIIAIKPEKILLTIGFIVMIIGKPLAPCWLPGLSPVSRHRRKSQLSPETRASVSCCCAGGW